MAMRFSTGHESKSGEGVGVLAFAYGWQLTPRLEGGLTAAKTPACAGLGENTRYQQTLTVAPDLVRVSPVFFTGEGNDG
jgi:hypothetical protein